MRSTRAAPIANAQLGRRIACTFVALCLSAQAGNAQSEVAFADVNLADEPIRSELVLPGREQLFDFKLLGVDTTAGQLRCGLQTQTMADGPRVEWAGLRPVFAANRLFKTTANLATAPGLSVLEPYLSFSMGHGAVPGPMEWDDQIGQTLQFDPAIPASLVRVHPGVKPNAGVPAIFPVERKVDLQVIDFGWPGGWEAFSNDCALPVQARGQGRHLYLYAYISASSSTDRILRILENRSAALYGSALPEDSKASPHFTLRRVRAAVSRSAAGDSFETPKAMTLAAHSKAGQQGREQLFVLHGVEIAEANGHGNAELLPLQAGADRIVVAPPVDLGVSNTEQPTPQVLVAFDNGWLLADDLKVPVGRFDLSDREGDPDGGLLVLTPFIDTGFGSSSGATEAVIVDPWKVGAGIGWEVTDQSDFRFGMDIPLIDLGSTEDRDPQELGFQFRFTTELGK